MIPSSNMHAKRLRDNNTTTSSSRCVMDGVTLPSVAPTAKFIGMSVYFFSLRTVFLTLAKASSSSSLSSAAMAAATASSSSSSSSSSAAVSPNPFSWPSPSLSEIRTAGAAYCALPWRTLEALAKDDGGWERFVGDAEQVRAGLGWTKRKN